MFVPSANDFVPMSLFVSLLLMCKLNESFK